MLRSLKLWCLKGWPIAPKSVVSSIPLAADLGKYLGFPLFQRRVKQEDFNFLINKLKSKLSGWKAKLLNRTGRITLARSMLIAMPLYNMQTMWVP